MAKAVGGGYCRLQTPLRLALGVRGTVAGRRLGALQGGAGEGGSPASLGTGGGEGVFLCRAEQKVEGGRPDVHGT